MIDALLPIRARAGHLTWLFTLATAIVILLPIAATHAQEDEPVYKQGGGVISPKLTYKTQPSYTEEARAAGIEGTVALAAVVSSKGQPHKMRVFKRLDPGLDAKAIECVSVWRFKPAEYMGKPVAAMVTIEVNFRLK